MAGFSTLATLTQKLAEAPCNTWIPRAKSETLKRAFGFTEARLDQPLAFAEVARAAHVSERTLARRFFEETGMTWRQVQRKMRMIRAMELLAEGSRVTKVALAVGYASQSAFSVAFKAFMGHSPTEFKRASA